VTLTVLPEWATALRPSQVVAIQRILDEFESGAQVVILDAPTGSGKTLIGEMVRQNLNARALYLCNSLSLQDQFARDFPDAKVLKGRTNYATADSPNKYPELNAGDCTKLRTLLPACYDCDPSLDPFEGMHCKWCHTVALCPYEKAKAAAIRSSLVCTNTSYFLYESNYVGNLPLARQLIIIDEADTLEDILMSFVEVSLTQRKADEYGIKPPSKKTVESAWIEWAVDAANVLSKYRITGDSVSAIRARNALGRLRGNIARLNDPATGLAAGGWVYTGYDHGHISFKPIEINHVAREYVWKHCPRFLLMSATTISYDVMAHTLGIDL
jgi:Rad3-related DNA helicase